MVDFLETPRFPGCPRYGYISEPMYSTTIIARASGMERRNQNWAYPLTRLTVTVGPSEGGDPAIQELLRFYHAVRGSTVGFRVKDWADFKSGEVGDEGPTWQPTFSVPGSPAFVQMVKRYTYGSLYQDRLISKPVQGTISVKSDEILLTENVDYQIDYTTGRIDFDIPPEGTIQWSGEFDIPCRFEGPFPIEIVSYRMQAVSFTLQEIRVGG